MLRAWFGGAVSGLAQLLPPEEPQALNRFRSVVVATPDAVQTVLGGLKKTVESQ